MARATLTSKWQMVIPKQIREHLNVKPGDQLDFTVQIDGKVVVRATSGDVRQLKGILSRPGEKRVSIQEMNRIIRRRRRGAA